MIIPLHRHQRIVVHPPQCHHPPRQLLRRKMPMQFRALQPHRPLNHLRARIIPFRPSTRRIHSNDVLPALRCGGNQIISRPFSCDSVAGPACAAACSIAPYQTRTRPTPESTTPDLPHTPAPPARAAAFHRFRRHAICASLSPCRFTKSFSSVRQRTHRPLLHVLAVGRSSYHQGKKCCVYPVSSAFCHSS